MLFSYRNSHPRGHITIALRMGMTQKQLAAAAEMERSYVSDLEPGTLNSSVAALGRIADALGVEPHLLLMNI